MTRDIFIILSSLLLCLSFLAVLFVRTAPLELISPYRSLIFLLIGFLGLIAVATGELVRAHFLRRQIVYSQTLRRGALVAFLTVTLLYLSSERLLGLWNVIPLVIASLLIELYASSRLLSQRRSKI